MILTETELTAGATMFFIKNAVKVFEIFCLDQIFDQMIRPNATTKIVLRGHYKLAHICNSG